VSAFKDPSSPEVKLSCACGRHQDQAAHDAASLNDGDALASRAVRHYYRSAITWWISW
jgi:hypothetical protein